MLTRRRPSAVRLIALAIALVAALAVLLGAMLSAAQAAPVGALKQFRVPTADTEPRSITNGSDGNRWFVEGNLDSVLESPAIGRITPAGDITEFPVDCSFCSLSDIVQGPDDVLYFTSNEALLGRIRTSGEFLAPIPMPDTDVLAGNLAVRGDEIWFTDFNNDSLWRYDVSDEAFTQFNVPEPSDVAVDEAGIVWFTAPLEPGIGRLDPSTGAVTVTPTTLIPRELAIAADGDIWFTARFTRGGRRARPGHEQRPRVPAAQHRPARHSRFSGRLGVVHPGDQGQHSPDHGLRRRHRGQGRQEQRAVRDHGGAQRGPLVHDDERQQDRHLAAEVGSYKGRGYEQAPAPYSRNCLEVDGFSEVRL